MRLLLRSVSIEKLYRTLVEYSTLATPSSLPKGRNAHIDKLLQTRMRNFLEQNKKNESNKEAHESPRCLSRAIENCVVKSNSGMPNVSSAYEEMLASIETLSTVKRSGLRTNTVGRINAQCCAILAELSVSEILHMLHSLMRSGLVITTMKLYRSSLLALSKELEKGNLDECEKLQLLFFESLGKKSRKLHVQRLLTHIPPLRDLGLMEKVIVAYSTYKCSVKLKGKDARALEEILERDAAELAKDPPILVTVCKAVSLACPSKALHLDNLSREVTAREERWRIVEASHILVMYARANHKNSCLMERLCRDSIAQIVEKKTEAESRFVRNKDVYQLVQALSTLGYKLLETEKEKLKRFVSSRYETFQAEPFLLVDTLLALWILDCRLHTVIDACLANGLFRRVKKQVEWKPAARLHLLLSCINIESPDTKLPAELLDAGKVGMKVPRSVKKLYELVEELGKKLGVKEVRLDCPVDGIYIAGVSLRNERKSIHIDVLDERTCFRRTNVSHGLMNLKLRLLTKIGYRSVLIPEQRLHDVGYVHSTLVKAIQDSAR